MKMIKAANEINAPRRSVLSISGVYFLTAFSGLFVPYLDPGATGYSRPDVVYDASHIVRAMLEGNVFLTHAVIDSMKLDSNSELDHPKVDGP
jgi:glycerol kinase